MKLRSLYTALICAVLLLIAAASVHGSGRAQALSPIGDGAGSDGPVEGSGEAGAGPDLIAYTERVGGNERVWHLTTPPLARTNVITGLNVLILNQQGRPSSARVEVYPPDDTWYDWQGYTDEQGRAEAEVAAGAYTLVVSSEADHFVVVREGIFAPGDITVQVTGTVAVQVTVRCAGGALCEGGTGVSFERFAGGIQHVGRVAPDTGQLSVDLSPGVYNACASSGGNNTYLHRPQVSLVQPTSLRFDPTQMPAGQVVLRLVGLDQIGLVPGPLPRWRSWSPVFLLRDGGSAVLSADQYTLSLHRELTDGGATEWIYYLNTASASYNILPGAQITLWAGPTYSATIAPDKPVCAPGDTVTFDARMPDAYGNTLRQINRGPSQQVMLGHLRVTGPQGEVVLEMDSRWYSGALHLHLAPDAAQGQYGVRWTLDTGPLAGVLAASAQFTVSGQPVTPGPTSSPTATQLPTLTPTLRPTSTPTPTSSPTPSTAWLSWAAPGAALCPGQLGSTVDAAYGNIRLPATLNATLSGAVTFTDGRVTQAINLVSASGRQTLALRVVPGSPPGSSFTLAIALGALRLERSGAVCRELWLPTILKAAPLPS